MTRYLTPRVPLLLLTLLLGLPAAPVRAADAPAAPTIAVESPKKVEPGEDDGRIAFWTAHLLQGYHYSKAKFDDSISSQFLDTYLNSLDPQHLHFLQSDIERFEQYRTELDNLTLSSRGSADTKAAYDIFESFMQRLRQRVEHADHLLKNETFTFDTDERIAVDRRKVPYPKDLEEAKTLWRQRVKFEYLQEKLGKQAMTAGASTQPKVNSDEPAKPVHEEIVDKLVHRYFRNLKMFADWNNEDVMGVYLTALANVYDPHSDYFNRAELEGFKISMNLQLFGIGAELRSEDGFCRIERLLPGGPAIKSNTINPGDHIIAVAQGDQTPVDVVDMHLTKIVQLIRGPKGTEVRLTVRPGGQKGSEHAIVTLIRDEIPLEDQAARGSIIEWPGDKGENVRLGIIHLPSFYAPMDPSSPVAASGKADTAHAHYTSVDVAKLLAKFKEEKVAGVILDLRMNGGGVLEEAIRVAGLFIRQGPIVQVRDLDDRIKVDRDPDASVAYTGPLMVLTSRFSASASEIVAGALQDYGRALVVGDASTHGKGTVQTVTSLRPVMRIGDDDPDEPGALKFTIRKFYRASGASTQAKGVLPDIVLPSRWNHSAEIGESSLDNAMPWDEIRSAEYEKLHMVQPYLSELLRRSSDRVSTNKDFSYVFEDIEEFRRLQADRTISLNEAQRLKEQAEAEARQKAREDELRSRKDPENKVYEISLKQADLPGLPPPVQKTNSLASVSSETVGAAHVLTTSEESDSNDLAAAGEEEKVPAVDPHLEEAQQILMDYVELLEGKNNVARTPVNRDPAASGL